MSDIRTMVPSRQTTTLTESYRAVKGTLRTNRGDLLDALARELGPASPQAAEPFRGSLDAIEAKLDRGYEAYLALDRAYRVCGADLAQAREERDDAKLDLRGELIPVRDVAVALLGTAQAHQLGFARRVPENPTTLREHGTTLLGQLAERDAEPRVRGFGVDKPTLLKCLGPRVGRLGTAIDAVDLHLRNTERTLIWRNAAAESYGRTFLGCARTIEALFLLAGLPEQAARVRPSGRRRGLTVKVANTRPAEADTGSDAVSPAPSASPLEDEPRSFETTDPAKDPEPGPMPHSGGSATPGQPAEDPHREETHMKTNPEAPGWQGQGTRTAARSSSQRTPRSPSNEHHLGLVR